MNALAMPISSRTAEDMLCACFCAKSPRIFEERAATDWTTRASSALSGVAFFRSAGCIPHDAIVTLRLLQAPGVVQIVQMGDRLPHGEEGLVRVERALEEHRQQLARAFRFFLQFLHQVLESVLVVRL